MDPLNVVLVLVLIGLIVGFVLYRKQKAANK